MKRIIALFLSVTLAACAADGADGDPATDQPADPGNAEVDPAPTAQNTTSPAPATTTKRLSELNACADCGPLPDPWKEAAGPMPDPWKSLAGASSNDPHK